MEKKRSEFRRSTIVRIVLVVIILVLPLNILTLVMSTRIIRNNRDQVYQEIQGALDLTAASLRDQLTSTYRRLTLLNSGNTDFRILEYYAEEGRMEQSASYSAAKTELNNVCSESGLVNAVYFYFRSRGTVLLGGTPGILQTELTDYVEKISGQGGVSSVTWETVLIDDAPILISHTFWNNADYGAVVNLDYAVNDLSINPGEGRTVFFRNGEGTIFTASGTALFEEKGLTLDEMRDARRYTVLETSLSSYDLSLVEVVEVDRALLSTPLALMILLVFVIALTILVIPILIWYINRKVNRPLRSLTGAMDQIESGDLDFRIAETEGGGVEFEQINRNFNNMMEQVEELKIESYELELEKKDIQMTYLSQQIQPHFILNTLNILYSYDEDEYPLSQKLILCLSKYFRYIVRVNSPFVELEQEMDHIRNYFEIQQTRYGEIFTYVVDYDERLKKALVPVLLIQNFAENTVKYSFRAGKECMARVTAEYLGEAETADCMRIRVRDTGVGLSDEVLEAIRRFKETGERDESILGVGIVNAIERLKYFYSDVRAEIRFFRDEEQGGTVVELILPIFFEEREERNENTLGG